MRTHHRIAVVFSAALLTTFSATLAARAQAPGAAPAAAPAPAAPPPAAVTAKALARSRLSIGLRVTALSVASTESPDNPIGLGGAGFHLRYRFGRRLSAELSFDHVQTNPEEAGFERRSTPINLGFAFHLFPDSRWDLTARGGVGITHTALPQDAGENLEFSESQAYLGVGLERRFRHLGIGADVRAIAMKRSDKLDGANPGDVDAQIPQRSSGAQVALYASWHF